MGKQSFSSQGDPTFCGWWAGCFVLLAMLGVGAWGQGTQATRVPIFLPAGLVYDAAGDLIFAESARHVVRMVAPNGVLTTIAGTGTQGFGGDGGLATAARLDTPGGLAIDGAGNLYIADTHNGRVRRVDAVSGVITTVVAGVRPGALAMGGDGRLVMADGGRQQVFRVDVGTGVQTLVAGNGVQGFSGDGGLAVAAALDTPAGVAVDVAGNVYLADAHNGRVRRVDAASGVITTVAVAGLPQGLVVAADGSLVFADKRTGRVLRVGVGGAITGVAGDGVEGFAGDGSAATGARLDGPGAVGLSTGGLVTLSDGENGRVRQIDTAGVIHTIAGLGGTAAGTLSLAGPSVTYYGSGAVTATLASSAASGMVTFFEVSGATPVTLGSGALVGNQAVLETGGLGVGSYRVSASYGGDGSHGAAESTAVPLVIAPLPVTAVVQSATMLYGQPVPVLAGSLTGVLARDAVRLGLTTTASTFSAPGVYGISAGLLGVGAGNYVLSANAAGVTVGQAPVAVGLSQGLVAQVVATTSGTPTGTVTLDEGGVQVATARLVGGSATFTPGLAAGSHTLTAGYGGDLDFLAGASGPTVVNIVPVSQADFTLTAVGTTSVTIPSGSAAQFGFSVTPLHGVLAGPILLTATGLPVGATATFNPAYVVPSGNPSAFILTVSTPKAGLRERALPYVLALFLPVFLVMRKRRVWVVGVALLPVGCGDRVNNSANVNLAGRTYAVTVTGTSTNSVGGTVQHSAGVTLILQ